MGSRRGCGCLALVVALLVVALLVLVSGTSRSSGPLRSLVVKPSLPPALVAAPLAPRPRPRASVPRGPEPAIRRLLRIGLPVYCGGRRGRDVALTFDDGPGPYTHLALKRLAEAHERATFFVVGRSMQLYPGYLRRELEVAAIGDHTYSHPPLTTLSRRQVVFQLRTAARMIERGTGVHVDLWRPPYELHDAMVDRIAHRLGLVEILWDVDSQDSLGADHRQIVGNVLAGLRPGAIIELHENHGQTIRALARILPALRRRHLLSVSVPHLLAVDPPSLRQLRAGSRGCPTSVASGGE